MIEFDPAHRERAQAVYRRLEEVYGIPEWREPLEAMDELVSTILSQNTNDRNRDQAFHALRKVLPTWEQVRDAPAEMVIEAIRPAGLGNQKGPRIQEVLRAITAERGNLDLSFLKAYSDADALAWLMRFKGVGPKTAAIVLAICLGQGGFPGRYARLPRQRAHWPAPKYHQRGRSPSLPVSGLRPATIRAWASQPDPAGARNLPCARARVPGLSGAGLVQVQPGGVRAK